MGKKTEESDSYLTLTLYGKPIWPSNSGYQPITTTLIFKGTESFFKKKSTRTDGGIETQQALPDNTPPPFIDYAKRQARAETLGSMGIDQQEARVGGMKNCIIEGQ